MIALLVFCVTLAGDFDIARENYSKGYYAIAQAFFEEFVSAEPDDALVPEATYYLIKIYDHDRDFMKFLASANKYLSLFKYNIRREEIFNLLLGKLVQQEAFLLAYDYVRKFDYLTPDSLLLDNLCLQLMHHGYVRDTLLALAPGNDSLKILYAAQVKNISQREKVYKGIKGSKGRILLTEHYLQTGDTLRAEQEYVKIRTAEIDDNLLYRLLKIALIFNLNDFGEFARRLDSLPAFSNKVKILKAWTGEKFDAGITPEDNEEILLLMQVYRAGILDTLSTAPPESLDIVSLFADTTDLTDRVKELRNKFPDNYFIDSLYCELLLRKNRIKEAYRTIEKYLSYLTACKYARKIRAFKYYQERNYTAAAIDIILSNGNEPYLKYMHAECLRNLGEKPIQLYLEAMKTTKDSVLHFRALKGYVETEFEEKEFTRIVNYPIELLAGDSGLLKKYVLSQVRLGRQNDAESLYLSLFGEIDNDYLNARGEYLIENKLYTKADSFYDSLAGIPEQHLTEEQYYNWALVPFLLRDYERSERRFDSFIKNYRNTSRYYPALFKIATIKYLKDDFDVAGDYYGLASTDSSLYLDALENQLVAYKKAENWKGVTQAGNKMLKVCPEAKKPEVYFEIGYAFLRNGNAKEGIKNLQQTLLSQPNQEYHYWLGEAYLGTGDFLRALYQYQKILKNFSKDEMWYPTAWFKSGLTIELLGDTEEARKVYNDIIKKRGPDDVWGSEAKKRLENLQ